MSVTPPVGPGVAPTRYKLIAHSVGHLGKSGQIAITPVFLNSSTVNWRDPATTNPTGRGQSDVKTFQFGALEATDNPGGLLGPDGQPLCGLGVDLHGLTQSAVDPGDGTTTGVIDPPANYTNPLRISEAGELWLDQTTTPTFVPTCVVESYTGTNQLGSLGDISLGTTTSNCVQNTTAEACLVERKISVLSAAIIDPPPSVGGGETIQFQVALPNYDVTQNEAAGVPGVATPQDVGNASVTCVQIEGCDDARSEVVYYVRVDGGFDIVAIRACTGTCPAASFTYELTPVFVQPGETYTMTAEPRLQTLVAPDGSYGVFPGTITTCLKMICLPAGGTFAQTPAC